MCPLRASPPATPARRSAGRRVAPDPVRGGVDLVDVLLVLGRGLATQNERGRAGEGCAHDDHTGRLTAGKAERPLLRRALLPRQTTDAAHAAADDTADRTYCAFDSAFHAGLLNCHLS